VDDLGLADTNEYPDHIEAQRVEEARSPLEEVLPGQGADGGLFAGGNGFEGMSESGSSAQLDFDEDERLGMNVETLKLRFRALLTEGSVALLELAKG
jgi:hypothetical protein